MTRVRFHGRGGQGAKTASRILGTAAFLEGFTAQDSPIYGAERRGAPVAAFTRIASGPILERGLIAQPDLVIVADETLLDDPTARALDGVTEATIIFVNSGRPADQVRAAAGDVATRVVTMDLTGLALRRLGAIGALSAPLGAVATRLVDLSRDCLEDAVSRELADLGVPSPAVEQNLALAVECYEAVTAAPVHATVMTAAAPAAVPPLWTPAYQPPVRGSAHIAAAGNTLRRNTGDWRTFRPVLDEPKCNGCTLCFVYCPEAAITLTDKDRPVIDYDHCKGCLLCVEECPTKALTAVREPAAHGTAEARP